MPAASRTGPSVASVGAVRIREVDPGAPEAKAALRLDTRRDLLAARRLYARLGFVEVEPFNDEEYAHHWLAKRL